MTTFVLLQNMTILFYFISKRPKFRLHRNKVSGEHLLSLMVYEQNWFNL